ncbi:YciI family protein [Muricoccus aerilatus]|uniref:YciI family protein n=1 Tax=Muricoccus aerilatus TaxID=452982 RepID=UPI000694065D|nr:YciI family protein [Roseomonas aerilata]
MTDTEEIAALKARMAKKRYFMMRRQVRDPSRIGLVLLAHYRWIIEMEKRDSILLSGPLSDRQGGAGVGMTILRTETWEEAERIAASDPFCTSGAMTFEIMAWQVNEGRLKLSVDLSDGTFHLA